MALLIQQFPTLEPELRHSAADLALPAQLRCFADFTRHAALEGRLVRLRACLQLANVLLNLHDEDLTAAIRHAYLPALHLDDVPQDPQLVRQFMPAPLYRELRRLPAHG